MMKSKYYLDQNVFPSEENTILIEKYEGYEDWEDEYDLGNIQTIQFVHKKNDGSKTTGAQSEQLVIDILEMTKKLFLEACKEIIE